MASVGRGVREDQASPSASPRPDRLGNEMTLPLEEQGSVRVLRIALLSASTMTSAATANRARSTTSSKTRLPSSRSISAKDSRSARTASSMARPILFDGGERLVIGLDQLEERLLVNDPLGKDQPRERFDQHSVPVHDGLHAGP